MAAVLAVSCAREIDSSVEIPKQKRSKLDPRLEQARQFFETNAEDLAYPDLALYPGSTKTRAEDYGRSVSLRWGKSRIVETDAYEAVQVLLRDGIKHFAAKEIIRGSDTIREATYWFSYLIIKRDKATDRREMSVFSVIADGSYYKKDINAAENLSFNEFEGRYDGDFSGVILLSDLEGRVTDGTRYLDGRATHRLNVGTRSESHKHSHDYTFRMCVHMTLNNLTKSGNWDDAVECLEDTPGSYSDYCWCNEHNGEWVEIASSVGSDSWGWDDADPYDTSNGFRNPNLSWDQTWTPQVGNTCFPTSVSYVGTMFGEDIPVGDVNRYYQDNYNRDAVADGVKLFDIQYIANEYLEQTSFMESFDNRYRDAVDQGFVVMTAMPNNETSDPNDYHSIIIVDYNGDNLVYLNPQDGQYYETDEDYVKDESLYNVSITGVKQRR